MRLWTAAAFAVSFSTAAPAQHHGQHQHQPANQPYAFYQQRAVKVLSEKQIADLKNGRGMGLALAGELNGYPGPLHVIELAGQLALNEQQRHEVKTLFDAMKAEAIPAGEALIARETALDRAFAENTITPEALTTLMSSIGDAQARLREVHLKYHLTAAALLTNEQRVRYAALRGYK